MPVRFNTSGGGVSSSDVTASKWDVVQGKKTVTTDSGDEVVEGTLPDIFTDTRAVRSFQYGQDLYCMDFPVGAYRRGDLQGAGGRVDIPLERLRQDIGYTDTSKVLTGTTIAGKAGTMPIVAPNVDGNKLWSTYTVCLEGLVDSGIYNSHYYNGVSYVRSGLPNLRAANIKKGVNIGGLVGTFQGFTNDPEDLYENGNNILPFSLNGEGLMFGVNSILCQKGFYSGGLKFDNAVNVSDYKKLVMDGHFSFRSGANFRCYLSKDGNILSELKFNPTTWRSKLELDITYLNIIETGTVLNFMGFWPDETQSIFRIAI